MSEHGATEWRVTGRPMVRIGLLRLPAIDDPDLSSSNVPTWVEWLRRVWHSPGFAEAISHTSTDLDRSVTTLLAADPDRVDVKKARKTVRAVLGYVVRSRERTTPFGLIAGVASGNFAAPCRAQFGEDHRYFVQPGGAWVREIVDQMIAWPEVRSSTGVVAAHSVVLQGNEVVVPQHGRPDHARSGEAHIKATPEVLHVLERAHRPVQWDALVESVCSLHPDAPVQEAEDMVLQMVRAGALMTDLSPPQSKTDLLRHLARKTCAAACTARLGQAADLLAACNGAGAPRERMYEISKELVSITGAQSIGVDALADAQVDLPSSVARAAEHAAHLLTALSAHPDGLPAWEGPSPRAWGSGTHDGRRAPDRSFRTSRRTTSGVSDPFFRTLQGGLPGEPVEGVRTLPSGVGDEATFTYEHPHTLRLESGHASPERDSPGVGGVHEGQDRDRHAQPDGLVQNVQGVVVGDARGELVDRVEAGWDDDHRVGLGRARCVRFSVPAAHGASGEFLDGVGVEEVHGGGRRDHLDPPTPGLRRADQPVYVSSRARGAHDDVERDGGGHQTTPTRSANWTKSRLR